MILLVKKKIDISQSPGFKAFMLGSGESLTVVTMFIVSIVLSRIFSKVEYAAYRQTLLICTFVTALLSAGLPKTLYYFLPRNEKDAKGALAGNLLLACLAGFIFMVFIWFGANEFIAKKFTNPQLRQLLLISSPYCLLTLPITSISAYLVFRNRVKILILYYIISSIVIFALGVGITLIWRTPYVAVLGGVIAAGIIFLAGLILMYQTADKEAWLFRMRNIWLQAKYTFPLILVGGVGIISQNAGKLLVSSMCTPEDFAVYINGAIDIPFIGIMLGSVASVLLLEFSGMYQRKEYEKIVSLLKRATIKCALFIFPMTVIFFAMAPEIIRILFSAKYQSSVMPFRVYLLMLPARIATYGAVIMATGKTIHLTYFSLIGLFLSILLTILLIPIMGATGAAVAIVIAAYIVAACFFILITRILQKPVSEVYPWAKLLKVLVASLIPSVIIVFKRFLPHSDFLCLSIVMPIYIILLIISFWVFNLVNPKQILAIAVDILKRKDPRRKE